MCKGVCFNEAGDRGFEYYPTSPAFYTYASSLFGHTWVLCFQWRIQDFWRVGGGGWPDIVPFLNFKLKWPQRGGWLATLFTTPPPTIGSTPGFFCQKLSCKIFNYSPYFQSPWKSCFPAIIMMIRDARRRGSKIINCARGRDGVRSRYLKLSV